MSYYMQSNIIPKTDSVKDILDPFKIDSWKAVLVLISGGRSLSSGYNNENITGWVANKQQKFLIVLEAASPRSGCQHNRVLVRLPCFWFVDCGPGVSHVVGRVPLIKAFIPLQGQGWGGAPGDLMPPEDPAPPLPSCCRWGITPSVPVQARTWLNLRNIICPERSQAGAACCMIPQFQYMNFEDSMQFIVPTYGPNQHVLLTEMSPGAFRGLRTHIVSMRMYLGSFHPWLHSVD